MKRESMEALLKEAGVAEDKIKSAVDSIMAENDKDIESEKAKATSKEGELTAANQTIKELKQTVQKYDGKDPAKLEQDLKVLQKKYDDDIKAEQTKAAVPERDSADGTVGIAFFPISKAHHGRIARSS